MPSIEEKNVPGEVSSGMVPTKNKTGYMFTERSKFSNATNTKFTFLPIYLLVIPG